MPLGGSALKESLPPSDVEFLCCVLQDMLKYMTALTNMLVEKNVRGINTYTNMIVIACETIKDVIYAG